MTGVSERSQHISNLKYEGYINQKCTAPIIDLFNNEAISCSISERPTMPIIDDMLMRHLPDLMRVPIRFFIQIRAGNTVIDGTSISYESLASSKVCPAKATALIMPVQNVFSGL
ncbi:hypothetical protein D2F16_11790 [Salmonella enterica]|nr:hypothetical protein [Salmonella enterica]EBN1286574.1 hypothetical protein [Salmonella enterica]ECG1705094.1 hypothetical protein [Salmonella enterica subsp. enterica]